MWFFGPLILAFIILEILTINLPSNFKNIGMYLESDKDKIEVLVLGSSKQQTAVNPAWVNKPTLSLASSSQHINDDFKLLKGTIDRLPQLKYVVFEISNLHLEIPMREGDFWKYNIYLKYYDVNAFDRPTYFGDRLVFFSNTSYFSYFLKDFYFHKNEIIEWNKFGFDTQRYLGQFKTLEYDEEKINNASSFNLTWENPIVFKKNTALVFKMLDFLKEQNKAVIINTIPIYKSSLRNSNIRAIKRRDSVLEIISNKYSNVTIFDKESDTLSYNVRDFKDGIHFNPDGAKIFTEQLNQLLESLD